MAEAKKFIATQQLFVGYALAHNPGDEVPADNVDRHGWQDGVAREGTKAADSAVEAATAASVEPAATTATPPPS